MKKIIPYSLIAVAIAFTPVAYAHAMPAQEITAPEALPPTDITLTGFTAHWNTCDPSLIFQVNVYTTDTLEHNTITPVFDEDFDNVNIGTLTSIEYGGPELDTFSRTPGWITDISKCYAHGHYVMYEDMNSSTLTTPVIDLSADNGRFDCHITAAAGSLGYFHKTKGRFLIQVIENDKVTETSAAMPIENDRFTDYTFTLSKGSRGSRLRIIYQATESYHLYIDRITVCQSLPAGSIVNLQQAYRSVSATTSAHIDMAMDPNRDYCYDVIARTSDGTVSRQSNRVTIPLDLASVSNTIHTPTDSHHATIGWYDMNGRYVGTKPTSAGPYIYHDGAKSKVIIIK